MLDLKKIHEIELEVLKKIQEDKHEPDKILIHIQKITQEAVSQHSSLIRDIMKAGASRY